MDLLDKGEKVIKKGMEHYFLLLYKDIFVILMHMFLKTLKLIGNIYYYNTFLTPATIFKLDRDIRKTATSSPPVDINKASTT